MKCPSKTSTGGFARFHQIIRDKCAQVFHIISQNDTANIATHQKLDLWYYNNMGSHGHTMKFLSNGLQNLSAIWKVAYEIMIFYPTSTFVEIKFFSIRRDLIPSPCHHRSCSWFKQQLWKNTCSILSLASRSWSCCCCSCCCSSHGDISGTKCGIIDPLVSKRPENKSE